MDDNRLCVKRRVEETSLRKYAKKKRINKYYVSRYINYGEEPTKKTVLGRFVRKQLGLDEVDEEKRRARAAVRRERRRKFNAKGWKSQKEFFEAIDSGKIEIPEKP